MSQSDIFRYVVAGLIIVSILGACVIWSVAAYRSHVIRKSRQK